MALAFGVRRFGGLVISRGTISALWGSGFRVSALGRRV